MELIQEFIASPYEAGGLVLDWPSVPPRSCVFVPLLLREGGVLAVVPAGFLDAGAMDAVVGPSTEVALPLSEEEEDGSLQPVDALCQALLVDFSLEVASYLSRYDPVTSPVEAAPFAPDRPGRQALASAMAWIAGRGRGAPGFLLQLPKGRRASDRSSRSSGAKAGLRELAEQIGNLVDLIPALTQQQVQDLSARQAALAQKAAFASVPPGLLRPPLQTQVGF